MQSRLVRRSAIALTVIASTVSAGPILLDFDAAPYAAALTYNAGQVSSSDGEDGQAGESLNFNNPDTSDLDNYMDFVFEQQWSAGTQQQPDPPLSDHATLHFEFQQQFSSPMLASFPVVIEVFNLNDVNLINFVPTGDLTGMFETNGAAPTTTPWTLPPGTGWSLAPGSSPNEYDLIIDFDSAPPSDLNGIEPTDIVTNITFSFDVVAIPEPATLALLMGFLLYATRRPLR